MAINTAENVKKPAERLRDSIDEYYRVKEKNEQFITFDEMMKRLEEDDE